MARFYLLPELHGRCRSEYGFLSTIGKFRILVIALSDPVAPVRTCAAISHAIMIHGVYEITLNTCRCVYKWFALN